MRARPIYFDIEEAIRAVEDIIRTLPDDPVTMQEFLQLSRLYLARDSLKAASDYERAIQDYLTEALRCRPTIAACRAGSSCPGDPSRRWDKPSVPWRKADSSSR